LSAHVFSHGSYFTGVRGRRKVGEPSTPQAPALFPCSPILPMQNFASPLMAHQITTKHDFEKAKLRGKANNADYRERFQEEGDRFERGGTARPELLKFRGSSMIIDRRPLFLDDKRSLIRTLESVKFVLGGHTGIVAKLAKFPTISGDVRDRFERTRNSILRADKYESIATHPKKQREFYVVPFTCFLAPAEALPDPIFKDSFAFSAKVPPAVAAERTHGVKRTSLKHSDQATNSGV